MWVWNGLKSGGKSCEQPRVACDFSTRSGARLFATRRSGPLQKVIQRPIMALPNPSIITKGHRMTANGLLKNLLHIRGAVVGSFDLGENAKGEPSLVVHVHVGKGHRWRCPVCGRKCHVHDYVCDEAFWRSMDFGPVEIGRAHV